MAKQANEAPTENEKHVDYNNLAWAIKSRHKLQLTALRLAEYIDECKYEFNSKQSRDLQDLVAVAFSLWRAAFLADREGTSELKTSHALAFCQKILTDNNITFANDVKWNEWSFNFYVRNSYLLLNRMKGKPRWKTLKSMPLQPPDGQRISKPRWDTLFAAFKAAVDSLPTRVSN